MATRQREPISPRWPSVATSASLPNVAGSPTQSSYLQVGDECYVSGDSALYVCVVATLGAAVWRIIGASGTYTPTATIVTNLDSVTPNQMEWMRIGNVVFVAGSVRIDPTAPGIVSYRITLPIASNFTLSSQLSGVCVTTSASIGNFVGDATNDAASVVAINSLTTAYDHIFTFGYEVV